MEKVLYVKTRRDERERSKHPSIDHKKRPKKTGGISKSEILLLDAYAYVLASLARSLAQ
jgi:hypothetical protein